MHDINGMQDILWKCQIPSLKPISNMADLNIEQCLNECIDNEQNVKDIIKYIKQKREIKYYNDIRRSYK